MCKKKDRMFKSASLQIECLLMVFWGFLKWKYQENTTGHGKSKTERNSKQKNIAFQRPQWKPFAPNKAQNIHIQTVWKHTRWQSQLSHQAYNHHNTCQQSWSISSTQQTSQNWHTPPADHQQNIYSKISHLIPPQGGSSRQVSLRRAFTP